MHQQTIWQARYAAAAAHGEDGQRDANWPDWYVAYMAAEQSGTELPM